MDFVIIANAWSASVDNPTSKHQIAMELARQGHRILWVEGAGMRSPSLGSSSDRSRILHKISRAIKGIEKVSNGIWRIAPVICPLPSLGMVRGVNNLIYRLAILSAVAKLNFNNPILVNFMPTVPGVLAKWAWLNIYYCVDRWDAFGVYDSGLMAKLDEQCCRAAGIVIASASDLYERCRKLNPNTHLVSHGVDYEHFASSLKDLVSSSRPADLPQGRIIGFIGLISEWVDQDLLVEIADEIPDSNIVLIGKADVPVDKLEKKKNIHFSGPKPFRDLPSYIAAFDVGIIPFIVNDLTRAVNPIKLREMLAAGCSVISTDLPEVEKYRGVGIACDRPEFVRLVKELLDCPLIKEQKQSISDMVKNETWEEKVKQILGLVRSPKDKNTTDK
ncbi:MAG: hypothetical protein A2283_17100 [Lentisphaerae bacterium RIFOXYA12_FULL_48_11]|nr:MAG: hypothetical protein A2283_17100 [Lentisphaerae bacterium RIFOXYA12_FULL_48_11]